MTRLHNPHDHFIKELLSRREHAQEFLRHYLPAEVVALLDIASTVQTKASFVDETLHSHYTDLIFQVTLVGSEGEEPIYIFVLFEHKSAIEADVAFQLLRYMLRMWEHHVRQGWPLYPILPVVFYHGEKPWTRAQTFKSLFEVPEVLKQYLPEFEFWLVDLARAPDEAIQGGPCCGQGSSPSNTFSGMSWGHDCSRFSIRCVRKSKSGQCGTMCRHCCAI